MIIVHTPSGAGAGLDRHLLAAGEEVPARALWIDLVEPTKAEEALVERFLAVDIPTREDMRDLEPSALLYSENGAHYMTARLLCQSDTNAPLLVPISFILTDKVLVTVRYDEPRPFAMFSQRAGRPGGCDHRPDAVLEGLLEAIIDRAAEILARAGDDIEALSHSVFEPEGRKLESTGGYQGIIRSLGRKGDLISHVRESMVSLERMLLFLQTPPVGSAHGSRVTHTWRTKMRDVQAIEDHAAFLTTKVQFILDATLGLVSLEQNKIIKIFSVAAVIFLPPTLIASSYGMNFKNMPELEWAYGYPMAIAMMVASAVVTYSFFRWKRWL